MLTLHLTSRQPSDFDNLGYAKVVFEDIYLTILRCDGAEWAKKLRERTMPVLESNNSINDYQQRYKQNWQSVHTGDVRRSTFAKMGKARRASNR